MYTLQLIAMYHVCICFTDGMFLIIPVKPYHNFEYRYYYNSYLISEEEIECLIIIFLIHINYFLWYYILLIMSQ